MPADNGFPISRLLHPRLSEPLPSDQEMSMDKEGIYKEIRDMKIRNRIVGLYPELDGNDEAIAAITEDVLSKAVFSLDADIMNAAEEYL